MGLQPHGQSPPGPQPLCQSLFAVLLSTTSVDATANLVCSPTPRLVTDSELLRERSAAQTEIDGHDGSGDSGDASSGVKKAAQHWKQ